MTLEIAGYYRDIAGTNHGFIYASGALSTVDVAWVRSTQLTRVKNGGEVTGIYTDALNERKVWPVNDNCGGPGR